MKKIFPAFLILAATAAFTLPVSANAASQSAGMEWSSAGQKKIKTQRRSDHRYADTRCHTYGGYGWGPYWGPCPYRGEFYYAAPGSPVLPFLPFGPFW